jgi:hypothetical protein
MSKRLSPEYEGRKPLATVEIDLTRHSLKGKVGDREPISLAGMEAAVTAGQNEKGHYDKVIKKAGLGQPIETFGSRRERTGQSVMFRMLGKHLNDASFENLDPQDLVKWLTSEGDVVYTESPYLDYDFGDEAFSGQFLESLKRNKVMEFFAKKSDQAALETHQKSNVSTLSTMAGNVGFFLLMFGHHKTEAMVQGGEDLDFAFVGSHKPIIESFVYKAILKTRGQEEADNFLVSIDYDGLKENDNIKLRYQRYDESGDDFALELEYLGEIYTISAQDLKAIIQEGFDFSKELIETLNYEKAD